MSNHNVITGDVREVLSQLAEDGVRAAMLFADPPDNLGLKYDGFTDKLGLLEYYMTRSREITAARDVAATQYWSVYYKHARRFWFSLVNAHPTSEVRQLIWRFTFGQHRHSDHGNGYRPIFRVTGPDSVFNPDAIRVGSARQKAGDKRANPKGRVPDDVWEFPRVVGNAKERCAWHPTQHPEALLERAILMSSNPGDLVIDAFSGTGTCSVVAKRLGRDSIAIEQSPAYSSKIRERINQA